MMRTKASTELRAPDPTLDSIEPNAQVGIDFAYGEPPIAHLVRWVQPEHLPLCADPEYGGVETASASHARWFAVPCRTCFPDAPPHGTSQWCCGPNSDECHIGGNGLAWQVAP